MSQDYEGGEEKRTRLRFYQNPLGQLESVRLHLPEVIRETHVFRGSIKENQ